jgi:16S rRNA (cytosine1402-N4)-methyltransferase
MHEPVLLQSVIELLDPHPGNCMIDGTVDGGGHAAAIIQKIMPEGNFLGVDWDESMIRKRIDEIKFPDREHYVCGNYADLPAILSQEQLGKADGLLLDLGFSSEQLEQSGRGFSFKEEFGNEPLYMTYAHSRRSVAEIIREESEESLANIIFQFGGERRSRQIAKAIKLAGKAKIIATSGELASVIRKTLPGNYEHGRIDPTTRTFQALRIYANGELENVEKVIDELPEILKPGARVVIITFHSLEDRIVKQKFQALAKSGALNIITKKPIAATREEIEQNPRSRSAKIRAAIIPN